MKKKILTLVAAAAMTLAMSVTAFAAGWVQNDTGWWWDNGDGTWPANEWRWLDGNADGVAECYYFGADGYMLSNTVTPDGYYVRGDGAWEINSIAQIKLVDVDPAVAQNDANKVVSDNSTATKSADEIIAYLTQFRDQDFGLFVNDNGRVKRGNIVGSGAGWQWYEMRAYSGFDGFCVALAFDDAGYLMTNATTPDGYQTNEYGQLIINGEVVMHDTHCLAANEVYGLYTDGTRFTDPNTVDTSKMDLWATTSYKNMCGYTRPFGGLRYNHVYYGVNNWGLGYNNCVDYYKKAYPNTAGDEGYYVLMGKGAFHK